MRKTFLAFAVILAACVCVPLAGCNAYQTAQRAHDVIAAITATASADIPALESAGMLSQSEGVTVSSFVALTANLNAQYQTCIENAGNAKKTLAVCVSSFGAGLSDPTELAQLRIVNANAQKQVEIWAASTVIALNGVIAVIGGAPVTAPVIGPAPTSSELQSFRSRVEAAL